MPAKKSRKVKAATKRKAFVSKKKLQGNIPLSDGSDADVDFNDLMHDDRYTKDAELSSEEENLEKLLIKQHEEMSEEEEVLPITDDEDDDKEEAEESEEYDEEDDLPNREAWGRRKSAYYNADFVDKDRGISYREEDAERARLEAEEASAIYRNLLSYVPQDKDIQIDEFEIPSEVSKKALEEEDPKLLTKEEKVKFLKKKFPQFFKDIKEFKTILSEVKDLTEMVNLSKDGKLKKEHSDFVERRHQLLLHYAMNMSFYMALKCDDSLASNHPVVQRIRSYKSLLDSMVEQNADMSEVYRKIKLDSEKAVKAMKPLKSKSVKFADTVFSTESLPQPALDKKKKKSKDLFASEDEKNILSLYRSMKEKFTGDEEEEKEEVDEIPMEEDSTNNDAFDNEMTAEEKRTITREIAKNKGLTTRRKKEHRNPRVHHRMKFRKAKIARKGQVRETIREVRRYDGEPTGISSHVVRSIRMK